MMINIEYQELTVARPGPIAIRALFSGRTKQLMGINIGQGSKEYRRVAAKGVTPMPCILRLNYADDCPAAGAIAET